jgi:hypothetical protein
MKEAAVKELMRKLHQELESADKIDPELLGLVRDLDFDIHRLMKTGAGSAETESILDRATALETQFAARHPVAEQVLREIVEALGKMGV